MSRITKVLFVLLAAVYGSGAVAALAGAAAVRDSWEKIGVPDGLGTVIGLLELAAAAGLLLGLHPRLSWLGTAAAAGLTALMIGAVAYHVRADDSAGAGPAVVLGLLALAAAVLSWRDRRSPARDVGSAGGPAMTPSGVRG